MNSMECQNCGTTMDTSDAYCRKCGYKNIVADRLYHYTSLETAIKILSNEKDGNIILWASRFDLMNDPNDCVYYKNEIAKFYSIDEQSMYAEGIPYFTSFSPLKDDLHMWNCYGDNGKGVAIGFKRDSLKNDLKFISMDKTEHIAPKLYRCHYLKETEIKDFFTASGVLLEQLTDREHWHFSYIIKHPCYKYELEERLLIASTSMTNHHAENHLEISVPVKAICEIVLGPHWKETALGNISLLEKYIPLVCNSQIPYK